MKWSWEVRVRDSRLCLLGMACMMLATGCGKRTGDLIGTISFQEKQVLTGSVTVVGADGIVHSGVIRDGIYSVAGIPTGPVKIAVSSPDPGKQRVSVRKPNIEEKPKADSTGWFAIPEKYGDVGTSELTFTLRRGKNQFNIELK